MSSYLPILIFSILADVVCNNSIIEIFSIQFRFSPTLLAIVMSILQTIAAPIQTGFSDFYCRKKSLIVALASSFVSLLLLFPIRSTSLSAAAFLWLSLILNSCFGNTVPIVWSAIADCQEKNLRFSLALGTSAYAIGYMVLAVFEKAAPQGVSETSWQWQDIIMPLILIGLSIAVVWKFYYDLKDRKSTSKRQNKEPRFIELARSEFFSLSKELRSSSTCFGLLAYFCWASSQYSTLLFLVDSQKYAFTIILMMFGYLAGVAALGCCRKISDEKIIRAAFIVTVFGMTLFFIMNPFMKGNNALLSTCNFLYTFGNAFLSPSILSLFSKEREFHEQGKGFGLIISADSAGFLIAIMAVKIFNHFKLELEQMILFSFVVFLISWFPYFAYEKMRKNAPRIDNSNK